MTPHKAWPAFVGARSHHCPLPWRVHCDSSIPVSPRVSHPALSSTLPFFPLSGLSSLIPYSTSLVPSAWQAPMAWRVLPCVGASSGASPGWSICSQPSSGSSLACLEPPQDLADGSRILISGMSCCSLGLELVEASPGPVTAPAVSLPALGHLGV